MIEYGFMLWVVLLVVRGLLGDSIHLACFWVVRDVGLGRMDDIVSYTDVPLGLVKLHVDGRSQQSRE